MVGPMRIQMGSKKYASDEDLFDCRVGPITIQIGTLF